MISWIMLLIVLIIAWVWNGTLQIMKADEIIKKKNYVLLPYRCQVIYDYHSPQTLVNWFGLRPALYPWKD